MKKSLLATSAALALASVPVIGAYAIDPQTHDVTVGSVDETVYSVDIDWGADMVYDWKYGTDSRTFGFKARVSCQPWSAFADINSYLTALADSGGLYSDANCSTPHTGTVTNGETYYAKDKIGGKISVTDFTQFGKVSATASFSPTSSYSWVVGNFANFGNVTIGGDILYYNDLSEIANVTPIGPSFNSALCVGSCGPLTRLEKYLYLEKAANASIDSQSINTSDKIGTVTINITPDYN